MAHEFALDHPAIIALKQADARLSTWIDAIGPVSLPTYTSSYADALAEMIVAQQLSGKVATVIWNRVVQRYGNPLQWSSILEATIDELRALGLSNGKATYLQGLAHRLVIDPNFFNDLSSKSDDYVIEKLLQLKGIGPWTAHMYLMFVLHRLDVVASGDLGLKLSLTTLYQRKKMVSEKTFIRLSAKWRPYRTIASLYLWRARDARLPTVII